MVWNGAQQNEEPWAATASLSGIVLIQEPKRTPLNTFKEKWSIFGRRSNKQNGAPKVKRGSRPTSEAHSLEWSRAEWKAVGCSDGFYLF